MLMFMAARRKEAVMVVVKCCLWVRGCVKGKGCGGGGCDEREGAYVILF